jgi:ABC-2 type transport system ATP-binding protein
MAGLGTDEPTVDADERRVVVPVRNGPAVLPECAARLARTGLQVSDLALRRPTLDDVFLSLTGRSTAPVESAEHPGRLRRPARPVPEPGRPR